MSRVEKLVRVVNHYVDKVSDHAVHRPSSPSPQQADQVLSCIRAKRIDVRRLGRNQQGIFPWTGFAKRFMKANQHVYHGNRRGLIVDVAQKLRALWKDKWQREGQRAICAERVFIVLDSHKQV